MSEPSVDRRLADLEKRVIRTQVIALVSAVLFCGALIFRNLRPGHVDDVRFGDDSGATLNAGGLHVGGASFTAAGTSAVNFAGAKGDPNRVSLSVTALRAASSLRASNHGWDVTVLDASPIVRLRAAGEVTSEIEIDTRTGAWSIARWVGGGDAKEERKVRTELLAPLGAAVTPPTTAVPPGPAPTTAPTTPPTTPPATPPVHHGGGGAAKPTPPLQDPFGSRGGPPR